MSQILPLLKQGRALIGLTSSVIGVCICLGTVPGTTRMEGTFLGSPFSRWRFTFDGPRSLSFVSPRGIPGHAASERKVIEDSYGRFEPMGDLYVGWLGESANTYVRERPRSYLFETPEGLWVWSPNYNDAMQLTRSASTFGPGVGWLLIGLGVMGVASQYRKLRFSRPNDRT